MEQTTLKKLPVGITDFRTTRTDNYYYVDKTSWIATLIDEYCWGTSLHLPRPHHFGKSLALDMVRRFFDCDEKEQNRPLFDGLAVSKKERWMNEQGKYPVLYLDLKTVKGDTQAELELALFKAFRNALAPLDKVFRHGDLNEFEKDRLDQVFEPVDATPDNISGILNHISCSMEYICRLLAKYYGQNVVILIDNYDTPLLSAYQHGFYKHINMLLARTFCSALKGNHYQRFGILIGTLRFPKPDIFSGLNNLLVENILDKDCADSFGFTPAEVEQLADYYGATEKLTEIKEWYGGYRVGEQELYNPDSVVRYFANKCTPQVYWPTPSSDDPMREKLLHLAKAEPEDIVKLVQGDNVQAELDPEITHDKLAEDWHRAGYSMLTVSGYLRPAEKIFDTCFGWYGDLAVPNKEMREVISSVVDPAKG